jgi:hypothetical protein
MIRDARRRMPSSALWERLAAEANSSVVIRRSPWGTISVAAALTVIALVVGVLLFSPERPTPQQLVERPQATESHVPVIPQHAAAQPSTQLPHTASASVREAKPQVASHRRNTHTVASVRLTPKAVESQEALPQAPNAHVTTQVAVPAPPTSSTQERDRGPGYYIEVSRGSTTSVLEGSVTQRDADGSTEIRIAYDATSPRMNGAN